VPRSQYKNWCLEELGDGDSSGRDTVRKRPEKALPPAAPEGRSEASYSTGNRLKNMREGFNNIAHVTGRHIWPLPVFRAFGCILVSTFDMLSSRKEAMHGSTRNMENLPWDSGGQLAAVSSKKHSFTGYTSPVISWRFRTRSYPHSPFSSLRS
jgi:hypothetical protein